MAASGVEAMVEAAKVAAGAAKVAEGAAGAAEAAARSAVVAEDVPSRTVLQVRAEGRRRLHLSGPSAPGPRLRPTPAASLRLSTP